MIPNLQSLLPVLPRPPLREMLRSGLGAGAGLLLADLILWALSGGSVPLLTHALLIAPFGATAFLIFAVPNSPLAQPWSAIVGNTLSALAALGVVHLGLPVVPAIGLAVLLAVVLMAASRAMHPPGGAVAIATVLLGQTTPPALSFALQPVLAGTVALVVLGVLWNRGTGRQYPFRQPSTAAAQRQTPGPLALSAALSRLRLGANLGVEDLSRLIAAAEAASVAQNLGPMTADQIMSRDLITVTAETLPDQMIALFRSHRFRHLPLTTPDGTYLGLIPLTAMLGPTAMPDPDRSAKTMPPTAPLADLLTLMAQGHQTCIPVTEGQRLIGLITRSDLLAALIHHLSN
ncbi:MAG: HPP family protein [bacterium]